MNSTDLIISAIFHPVYIEREKIWPALNVACVPYNRAAQKAIESIPAADVRPVVRGKWVQGRTA